MPDHSSSVCRDILDTKSVIQNQTLTALIDQLVATGRLSKEECQETNEVLKRSVEIQMNNLVDRVLKSFQDQQTTITKPTRKK